MPEQRTAVERELEQLGALPGFGKNERESPKVEEMIKDALLH